MKLSTGLRNAILASGSLKATLDGGEIRIYSGSPPVDADAAVTGTLLCTVKHDGEGINFAASAAGGILSKDATETWSGVNAATGTAGYFRHVLSADAGGVSTTAPRIQGTIAVAGADLNISSTALTSGATQAIAGYSVTVAAG